MGRTTPTITQNVMMEKSEWKAFRDLLPKADRKIFDDLFDTAKFHSMAMMASIPSHPVRIQLIFMSVVFYHYKQLTRMMTESDMITESNL